MAQGKTMLMVTLFALPVLAGGTFAGYKYLWEKPKPDLDKKYLACMVSVAEQDGKNGLLVTIENSGPTAYNVEWEIIEPVNVAIRRGNKIVNKKSTETFFHIALDQEKPSSGEVKLLKYEGTADKALAF
ncbi:MAG: hypothetical protein LBC63_06475 [Holophagales bacterium]|jgi:hypothetical protein|nr:hypothetical protein [Holophagales bacterium]